MKKTKKVSKTKKSPRKAKNKIETITYDINVYSNEEKKIIEKAMVILERNGLTIARKGDLILSSEMDNSNTTMDTRPALWKAM